MPKSTARYSRPTLTSYGLVSSLTEALFKCSPGTDDLTGDTAVGHTSEEECGENAD